MNTVTCWHDELGVEESLGMQPPDGTGCSPVSTADSIHQYVSAEDKNFYQ